MQGQDRSNEELRIFEVALGYLNFSSGAADPRFLASLNGIFEQAEKVGGSEPLWQTAWKLLERELDRLNAGSAAFQDIDQALQAAS